MTGNPFDRLYGSNKTQKTYEVLPDGRVQLRVFMSVGDEAYAKTPWHGRRQAMLLSVAEIARDCDLPEGEVVGRDYTASGDETGLYDFRLVYDPRV